jgi:hypothetical protein
MPTYIADDVEYIAKRQREIREAETRPTRAQITAASGSLLDAYGGFYRQQRGAGESDYTFRMRVIKELDDGST